MSENGGRVGHTAVGTAQVRPVDVPVDLEDDAPTVGVVRLPPTIAWSGEGDFDLADRRQLCRVYEQVLRKGISDEIRAHVNAGTLLDVFDSLYLPSYVRAAWEPWVAAHRGDHRCR